jgi:hypothetical protein
MARGLLGSRALTRRSPPNEMNLLNQATRKNQYVPKRKAYLLLLPCCAFDGGFKGPSDLPAKWHVVRNESNDMKGKIVGDYERSQLTSNTSRRLEMTVIWKYHFSRR